MKKNTKSTVSKPDPAGEILRRAMENPGIKEVMDIYNRIAFAQGVFLPVGQFAYPPYVGSSMTYTLQATSTAAAR